MKRETALLLALLVLSPGLFVVSFSTPPTFSLGIVLVDDTTDYYAEIIVDGFAERGAEFSVTILPENFNATAAGVREKSGFYLNRDIAYLADPLTIAGRHNIDAVLLLTDHKMTNWDEDWSSIWAATFPEVSAMVMSTYYLDPDNPDDELGAQQIAYHEVLHLLGYTHNALYQKGIMGEGNYSAGQRELLPYEAAQLPLRARLAQTALPTDFVNLVALTRLAWAALLLPAYSAAELALYRRYRKLQPEGNHHMTMAAAGLLATFGLLMLVVESFVVLLLPLGVMVGLHEGYNRWFGRSREHISKAF